MRGQRTDSWATLPPVLEQLNVPRDPSGQDGCAFFGAPMMGAPAPFGAHYFHELGAHNFVLYSSTAAAVSLVLFTPEDLSAGRSTVEVALDPFRNRTGSTWHIALPGLNPNLLYGYRIDGGHQDKATGCEGLRHDASCVVLDPYAETIVSRSRWGQLGPPLDYESSWVLGLAETWPQAAATLPDPFEPAFDWQGDAPLNNPIEELVIYEAHVRGFTADPGSGVSAPGTYQGMVERLDYLQSLGVTAIELLPVFEFNELEYFAPIPGTNMYRFNFWGYSTSAYFAPMARFSAQVAMGNNARAARDELKLLIRECHNRSIEVILDVVFNHTAEGNENGPHISFRGIDNRTYYMLAPGGQYYNYSGCGNTLNCNDPVVRQFVLDCLRYWVQEFHVDGFRFDLASILTRAPSAWLTADWQASSASGSDAESGGSDGYVSDGAGGGFEATATHSGGAVVCEAGFMTDGAGRPTGTPLAEPPLVEMISEDPLLRNTKMIAEAWDCDGLKQVGAFPHFGGRWAEWNGDFRDNVRQFIKGTDGDFVGLFAAAMMGSPETYAKVQPGPNDWWGLNDGARWRGGRTPAHTINFVTAHDGFSLADLVSYNEKHNEMNGENNNDGERHNLSWNCGAEGPTTDAAVNILRQRQLRNFAAALLLAQGVPMFPMGDEYGHTKSGNNNTYCHDSHLNYLNWEQARADAHGLRRFWSHMIRFRKRRPELAQSQYLSGGQVKWHGVKPNAPEWQSGRFIAYTLHSETGALYIAFNTSHLAQVVQLPDLGHRKWQLTVDTAKTAPFDFLVPDERLTRRDAALALEQAAVWTDAGTYAMMPWSCVVMEAVDARSPADAAAAGASLLGAPPGASHASLLSSMPAGEAAPPPGLAPALSEDRAKELARVLGNRGAGLSDVDRAELIGTLLDNLELRRRLGLQ